MVISVCLPAASPAPNSRRLLVLSKPGIPYGAVHFVVVATLAASLVVSLNESAMKPPQVREVKLSQLAFTTEKGAQWNTPGHIVFERSGIRLVNDTNQACQHFDIALDGNDPYLIFLENSGKIVSSTVVTAHMPTGMDIARVPCTGPVTDLRIFPIGGDYYYSVGGVQVDR